MSVYAFAALVAFMLLIMFGLGCMFGMYYERIKWNKLIREGKIPKPQKG